MKRKIRTCCNYNSSSNPSQNQSDNGSDTHQQTKSTNGTFPELHQDQVIESGTVRSE
jgi:hypothetical protein